MIGYSYKLFGTATVFEITGEDGGYWVIAIRSPEGEQLDVRMKKMDLEDGIKTGKLEQL